jgi:hypothetical protein
MLHVKSKSTGKIATKKAPKTAEKNLGKTGISQLRQKT